MAHSIVAYKHSWKIATVIVCLLSMEVIFCDAQDKD